MLRPSHHWHPLSRGNHEPRRTIFQCVCLCASPSLNSHDGVIPHLQRRITKDILRSIELDHRISACGVDFNLFYAALLSG